MIGNDLLFDSNCMRFCNLTKGDDICLPGVKGRCFKCLVVHSREGLATRKQLFEEVWGDFGLCVSDSSLLQTIYALRRDLKDFGIHDLIITHPRLGYQINPAYEILPVHKPPGDTPSLTAPAPAPAPRVDEPDSLKVELINKHNETERISSKTQTGISATLVLHGRKVLVIILFLLIGFVFFVLSYLIRKTEHYHYRQNGDEGDVYIIQSPGSSLSSCRCVNNKQMGTVDIQGCICERVDEGE
ncbi:MULTISPECIES: winged helix-turn-helix domain-containing protein [Enterobacterales]|uniref:winged helix-turn-helix domain-containing protein n=1 Tax=Enterobacterales TaxID=91347 RepID=UPI002EDAFB4A